LVSETVIVDKKNTCVGWVFDFFVIPICSDYLEEKKQNERTIGFGYLKIFRIKIITGLRYFTKKIKSQKHPFWVFQKLQRTVGFDERTGKHPTILGVCLIYFKESRYNWWFAR